MPSTQGSSQRSTLGRAGRPAALLSALALAACSAGSEIPSAALSSNQGAPVAASGTEASPSAGYALTAEERDLDCRRLTGRMKIRILQIRDYHARQKTSDLSRSLHSAQTQFGASATGSDPDGEYARDRAMLMAYNGQLAAKGCKTLDLEAELKQP